jgi:transposase-like protein
VTCHNCRIEAVKNGKGRNQLQRYKCQQCGKRFTEPHAKPFGADVRLPKETVERILHCLMEGASVRATGRLCGVEPKTVLAMLKLAGENCEKIMGRKVRNVKVTDVQCDEMWGFVGKKEQHKSPLEAHDKTIGDAYTFVAIERNTKLVLNFALGRRDKATTDILSKDCGMRLRRDRSRSARTASSPTSTPSTILSASAWTMPRSSSNMATTTWKASAGTRRLKY